MSYDQLSRDYEPRGRIEENYSYNTVPPQEKSYPRAILGADVKQRQQGGVTREMQQFEKNLHALASVIDSLDSRLASACIPANETSPGLRGTEGSGCSLANQLSAFNAMLSCQINRIEMIYQGVDL